MIDKISIVMPCYNGIKYIQQAIDSILTQSFQNWELLVSDDGSNDGTREYLRTLSDPRIKVFLQAKNLGIFGNLNFLFFKNKASVVQVLCQDDFFIDESSLGKIADLWNTLPPEVAFARCNHGLDAHSSLPLYEGEVLPSIVDPAQSDLYFFTFGCIPGNLSNVSLRADTVEKFGWFRTDLPYAGDFEFWSRVGARQHWAISRLQVVSVRCHKEQASATLNKKGELIAQHKAVISQLYGNLVHQGYGKFRLKLMATVNYISFHRDTGVKQFLKGFGSGYLMLVTRLLDTAPFSLGVIGGWGVFVFSLGGRLFKVAMAQQLLNSKAYLK